MKLFVWALLIMAAAVSAAIVVRFADGNVALLWPPYRLDLSINLAIVLLILAFLTLHLLLLGLYKAMGLPAKVRKYQVRRSSELSAIALRDATVAYFEGRYGRSERLAGEAQHAPDQQSLAQLIGARSAHRMREFSRRDQWMEKLAKSRQVEQARLMSVAEFSVEERRGAEALEAVNQLHAKGARHIQSLRIALRAAELEKKWPDVLRLTRALEKRSALHPVASRALRLQAFKELFAQPGDKARLQRLWSDLMPEERLNPNLATAVAQAYCGLGQVDQARQVLETAIEGAEPTLPLIRLYSSIEGIPDQGRLAKLEKWYLANPRNVGLAQCLAQVCIRLKLWGKAQEYLAAAMASDKNDPRTHYMLAAVYQATGRESEAQPLFEQAARLALA